MFMCVSVFVVKSMYLLSWCDIKKFKNNGKESIKFDKNSILRKLDEICRKMCL